VTSDDICLAMPYSQFTRSQKPVWFLQAWSSVCVSAKILRGEEEGGLMMEDGEEEDALRFLLLSRPRIIIVFLFAAVVVVVVFQAF
jgi:hypothetical protein